MVETTQDKRKNPSDFTWSAYLSWVLDVWNNTAVASQKRLQQQQTIQYKQSLKKERQGQRELISWRQADQ